MIYFDNAASTPLQKRILELWPKLYHDYYANPSSPHLLGKQGANLLQKARETIAEITNVSPGELYFTSGATEAINTIIQGYASFLKQTSSPQNEIIISSIEHSSVHNTALSLKRAGWKVHMAPVDSNGIIDSQAVVDLVNEKSAIVSLIHINNEVGTIQDIHTLSHLVKEKNPRTLFLVDSAQALGKTTYTYSEGKVDGFFLSGHKIGAPKGTGLFFLNRSFRINPLFYGGGQEKGYRSGTTDPIGAYCLSIAFEELAKNLIDNSEKVHRLNNTIIESMREMKIDSQEVVEKSLRSPYILPIIFPFTSSNQLIKTLSKEGFLLSGGAACTSSCGLVSKVLKAIGKSDKEASSFVRISFSHNSSTEEVKQLVKAIKKVQESLSVAL